MATSYKRSYDDIDNIHECFDTNDEDNLNNQKIRTKRKNELYEYNIKTIELLNVNNLQISIERMNAIKSLNEFITEHVQFFGDAESDPQHMEQAKHYWNMLINVMLKQIT